MAIPKMDKELDMIVTTEKNIAHCSRGQEEKCAKAKSSDCNCMCNGVNHGTAKK